MRQVGGSARLTGPVEGQPGIIMAGFDLGQVGYTLEEFFLESAATCFEPAGPAGADGYWLVTPSGQAPFATRLVVCRPSDPGAFTGTVILEWLNVSAGFDAPAHWMLTHRQVVRAGWAWVGVSAQRAGIEGGSIFEAAGDATRRAVVLPALKEGDPVRYGALHHPGDAFCFDIFSQAGRAVRDGGVLGPLSAECLLAAGQSQSAIHLFTYVNAVAPTVPPAVACDGYLIGSRAGFAAPLTGWGGRIRSEGPDGARVRTDGRAPVLTVQTESDVTGVLAGVAVIAVSPINPDLVLLPAGHRVAASAQAATRRADVKLADHVPRSAPKRPAREADLSVVYGALAVAMTRRPLGRPGGGRRAGMGRKTQKIASAAAGLARAVPGGALDEGSWPCPAATARR